jgi:hypothetical protein
LARLGHTAIEIGTAPPALFQRVEYRDDIADPVFERVDSGVGRFVAVTGPARIDQNQPMVAFQGIDVAGFILVDEMNPCCNNSRGPLPRSGGGPAHRDYPPKLCAIPYHSRLSLGLR